MDELAESLQACITAAQEVVDGLPARPVAADVTASAIAEKLRWIERQIASLLSKLMAVQEDMAAGLNLAEMGFDDPQDMHDWLGDVRSQISHLRAQQLALTQGLRR